MSKRRVKPGPLVRAGYKALLEEIKGRIRTAQVKAVLSVNRELIALYWEIGKRIVYRQQAEGWGKSVIERLARDLLSSFPGLDGFSSRNLWRMRTFYLAHSQGISILPQAAAELKRKKKKPARSVKGILPQAAAETAPSPFVEIPWFHNVILLEKVKDPQQRSWYAQKTIEHGWSRTVLTVQIESKLFRRQGKATTNFALKLPPAQSDLARQTLKDPYIFDFLTLGAGARERELEKGLLAHIEKFLIELGVGFSFVGRQVHLEVGGQDFFIDLLFYHLRLRCFVAIDLKMEGFKPEFAGKMNFYLSALDEQMRHPNDKPSIGLILCKAKDRLVVEYALREMAKPIGVAAWQTRLVESLPENLKGSLPTVEEIERELGSTG